MEKFILADLFVSEELERAILASISLSSELFFSFSDRLKSDAFVFLRADAENLKEQMAAGQEASREEWRPFVVPPEQLPEKVAALLDLQKKRALAHHLQQAMELMRTEARASAVKRHLEDAIGAYNATEKVSSSARMTSVEEMIPSIIDELKKRYQKVQEEGTQVVGLPTGLKWLDEQLGGLNEGLVVLGAPPGAGKTTFALSLCRNISAMGNCALFVTFEETPERLAAKAIAASAGLELKRFQDALSDPAILEQEAFRIGQQLRGLFILEGNTKLSLPEIKARFEYAKQKRKAKNGVIVIDYLQRACSAMEASGEYRHMLDQLLGQLRELALSIKAPMLIIAAQNRSGQGSSSLTSFRDSSGCEYSADVALLLCENSEGNPGNGIRAIDLVIAKNRFGAIGKTTLFFNPAIGTFSEEQ